MNSMTLCVLIMAFIILGIVYVMQTHKLREGATSGSEINTEDCKTKWLGKKGAGQYADLCANNAINTITMEKVPTSTTPGHGFATRGGATTQQWGGDDKGATLLFDTDCVTVYQLAREAGMNNAKLVSDASPAFQKMVNALNKPVVGPFKYYLKGTLSSQVIPSKTGPGKVRVNSISWDDNCMWESTDLEPVPSTPATVKPMPKPTTVKPMPKPTTVKPMPKPAVIKPAEENPIDCKGSWSEWTPCNAKCDDTGLQQRHYSISEHASSSGKQCPSPLVETRNCQGKPCDHKKLTPCTYNDSDTENLDCECSYAKVDNKQHHRSQNNHNRCPDQHHRSQNNHNRYPDQHHKSKNKHHRTHNQSNNENLDYSHYNTNYTTQTSVTGLFTETGVPPAPSYLLVSPNQ